jgi:DNA-binding CsgD family transcriptional regulator/tetratricopeptide (TPR) repeat protein
MTNGSALQHGRDAFDRHNWADAYNALAAADQEQPLDPQDLERLSIAAYLTGQRAERTHALLARTHHAYLERGDTARAVQAAFWLMFALQHAGDRAQAAGWMARAQRLLNDRQSDCVERGYLLVPQALLKVANDPTSAAAIFAEAAAIGDRFGDATLASLARQGHGRALLRLGEIATGTALLDEAMVAVTAGDVSPAVAGTIYCSVISGCVEIFDLRRAQEWTDALNRWCASQPGMVAYRGDCLVHRAEVMMAHGDWPQALEQARDACDYFERAAMRSALGAALYLLGDLHRLRGDVVHADEAYRRASETGRTPLPGLALLWLAQGDTAAARAALSRALEETTDRRARAIALTAYVDVLLAAGDVGAARRTADELAAVAATLDAPLTRATADQRTGSVLLAEGNHTEALRALHRARAIWRDLDVPYEVARVTALIGRACHALGDRAGGDLELGAARRAFSALGAAPDVARLDVAPPPSSTSDEGVLTTREIQVLRLIACGKTNRAIADDLQISEKTVARHVSNIFVKLDVSSRAGATAYAFQHQLVTPRT